MSEGDSATETQVNPETEETGIPEVVVDEVDNSADADDTDVAEVNATGTQEEQNNNDDSNDQCQSGADTEDNAETAGNDNEEAPHSPVEKEDNAGTPGTDAESVECANETEIVKESESPVAKEPVEVTEEKRTVAKEEKVTNGDVDVEKEPERVFNLPAKDPNRNYGIKVNPEEVALDAINKEIMEDADFKEVEDLETKLDTFKAKYMEFDKDKDGNIDLFGLKRMMEKLGQAKTHLEMKKMIREIDTTNTGTICYRDFVGMMCGTKTSVLKLILMFEEKSKEKARPTGVAPKRDLSSLP